MSKCKWMKKGECTNQECLFLGYSAVWCCVCKLKDPVKCAFETEEGECGWFLPDCYTKCKSYDKCQIYKEQVKEL